MLVENMVRYSGLGVSGATLGIVAIFILILFKYVFIWGQHVNYIFYVALSLGIISIILGAVSYFGKRKDKIGLVGVILGIIVIVLDIVFSIPEPMVSIASIII